VCVWIFDANQTSMECDIICVICRIGHFQYASLPTIFLGQPVVVWSSVSVLVLINEVNLHRAWLVLGWVTNCPCLGLDHGDGVQDPSRYVTNRPDHTFVGRHNEYQPMGGDALWLGSKTRCGLCVIGR